MVQGHPQVHLGRAARDYLSQSDLVQCCSEEQRETNVRPCPSPPASVHTCRPGSLLRVPSCSLPCAAKQKQKKQKKKKKKKKKKKQLAIHIHPRPQACYPHSRTPPSGSKFEHTEGMHAWWSIYCSIVAPPRLREASWRFGMFFVAIWRSHRSTYVMDRLTKPRQRPPGSLQSHGRGPRPMEG